MPRPLPFRFIQAPMAGVQGHQLAAAVCHTGQLGSLPAAMWGPEQLQHEIAQLRSLTDAPYAVNFFCHTPPELQADTLAALAAWQAVLAPHYARFGLDPTLGHSAVAARQPFNADMLALLRKLPLNHRPAWISFHFGLPNSPLLHGVRDLGCAILCSATTLAEAQFLQQQGVDAIIAQGLEAGGHRGRFLRADLNDQLPTLALLQALRAGGVTTPLIAAGGLATAAQVQAAMQAGASAVQIGTAFLCSHEASTSALHRQALLARPAAATQLTQMMTGRPARGLVNRLMQTLSPDDTPPPPFPLATNALAPLRAAAEQMGHTDFTPLWAGTGYAHAAPAAAADIVNNLLAT